MIIFTSHESQNRRLVTNYFALFKMQAEINRTSQFHILNITYVNDGPTYPCKKTFLASILSEKSIVLFFGEALYGCLC